MSNTSIRKIEVVDYDPKWVDRFHQEAEKLKTEFRDSILRIHHFGSTSIPGMPAKPVIDILVEVVDINEVDRGTDKMIKSGYFSKGEFGIAGRRFFGRGTEAFRTHHIHFYQAGNSEIDRHLDFRDYMLAHPNEKRAYGRLKWELAEKFPESINGYNQGKAPFITEIDRKSRIWKSNMSESGHRD